VVGVGDGVDDGAGVGTAGRVVARPVVRAAWVGIAVRFPGVGLAVRLSGVRLGSAGTGDADGLGGTDEGRPSEGGASGTVGDVGAWDVDRRIGSATRAATAHTDPTPTAVRSSRRRAAPRRIAS
jgi:hypothetical protein